MAQKHLDFIRSLSCLICRDNTATEAAHIRFSDARVGKTESGMGRKPDDCWTVPLCGDCHQLQHSGSERAFWQELKLDPIFVAMALHRVSGDHELGERIMEVLRGD